MRAIAVSEPLAGGGGCVSTDDISRSVCLCDEERCDESEESLKLLGMRRMGASVRLGACESQHWRE